VAPLRFTDPTGLSAECATAHCETVEVSADAPHTYVDTSATHHGNVCGMPLTEDIEFAINPDGTCYTWFYKPGYMFISGSASATVPTSGTPDTTTTTQGPAEDRDDTTQPDPGPKPDPKPSPKPKAERSPLLSSQSPNDCGSGFNVPNTLAGYNINSACGAHDACYEDGPGGKFSCDVRFALDIRRTIRDQSRLVDYLSLRVTVAGVLADMYFIGVTVGGWPAYSASRPGSLDRIYRFGE
jgi:hypothetical protein